MRFLVPLPRPPTESLAPVGGVSPLGRLLSLDGIIGGYVLATVLVVLVFAARIPGAGWIAAAHLGGLATYLLLRWGSTRIDILRPVFVLSLFGLVIGIYEGMGFILPFLRDDTLPKAAPAATAADAWLALIDQTLFHGDPTTWFTPVLTPGTVLLLQICYTSYFFLALVVVVVVLGRKRYRSFLSYTAVIIGCFFTTYVGYYLWPAYGPRVFYEYAQSLPHSELSAAIYRAIDTADLIHLNAFPSGHTAVTLVYLAILFGERRRIAWFFLPLVAGLIVATVALRYHYLIDVIAGVIVAAGWIYVGMPAVFRFDNRPVPGRTSTPATDAG